MHPDDWFVNVHFSHHAFIFSNLLFNDIFEQRVHVWSMINLSAEDQLRQRMAFALSNIFVVNLANVSSMIKIFSNLTIGSLISPNAGNK